MNKLRYTLRPNDKFVNIPIISKDDSLGINDGLIAYENEVVEQVINPIEDFEVHKFSFKEWGDEFSDINYNFNFYNEDNDQWEDNYVMFDDNEIYYISNAYNNSFFKLDFYDTNNSEQQKIYFTLIIPTQQGLTKTVNIGTQQVPKNVEIRKPNFKLDFIGDKEGYFIYWLKNNFITNNKFYISCKFFDAKNGEFKRMININQKTLPNEFNVNKSEHFYYECNLDYDTLTYNITKNNTRYGLDNNPIKFYEYINQ